MKNQYEKVFNNSKLRYEGEISNGMLNGYGRSYYENGILEYDGEWKNGKFDGLGKIYRVDGTLMHQGTFKAGVFVKDPLNGLLRYEGGTEDGKFHGAGRIFYEDGKTLMYEGEFSKGKFHGNGRSFSPSGKLIFDGKWLNGSFIFNIPDTFYEKAKIEINTIDPDSTCFSTFQSHNQKVISNKNGIFITYIRSRNDTYTAQKWLLIQSKDNGKSFRVVYSDTAPTNPPCIETDKAGNIYLAYPNFVDGNSYLLIFKAEDNYYKPSVSIIKNSASGKFCMAYDQIRERLYYFSSLVPNPSSKYLNTTDILEKTKDSKAQMSTNTDTSTIKDESPPKNTFTILDTSGNTITTIPLVITGNNAKVEYPQIYVDERGNIHTAWTTENRTMPYLYWSIHYLRSEDGGFSWRRKDGTRVNIPIMSDETGEADIIISPDEFGVHTWLTNISVKDDKIHFVYSPSIYDPNSIYSGSTVQWEHYQRYDIVTGLKDLDIQPVFRGENIYALGADGFFVHNPHKDESALYYVSRQGNRIICLCSRDNGVTWKDYAVSSEFENSIYAIGGSRKLSEDGYIMGTFTTRKIDENYSNIYAKAETHFFKIRAGVL